MAECQNECLNYLAAAGHFGLLIEYMCYLAKTSNESPGIIKNVDLGPVVHSIVSLTSSLGGQLVKCFMTLLSNTPKFFVEKMREAFALQKLLTFFQQKNIGIFEILMFEILTKR